MSTLSHPACVVVAEDDPDMRSLVSECLRRDDHRVLRGGGWGSTPRPDWTAVSQRGARAAHRPDRRGCTHAPHHGSRDSARAARGALLDAGDPDDSLRQRRPSPRGGRPRRRFCSTSHSQCRSFAPRRTSSSRTSVRATEACLPLVDVSRLQERSSVPANRLMNPARQTRFAASCAVRTAPPLVATRKSPRR